MAVVLGILLSVVLWLLAVVLGLVLLVLLLLLLVPFELRADGWISGWSADGQVAFRWGFGFVSGRFDRDGFCIRILGVRIYAATVSELLAAGKRDENPDEGGPSGKPATEKSGRRTGGLRAAGRRFGTIVHIVLRLLKTVRLRGYVGGVLGFDCPADTACAAGALSRLNGQHGGLVVDVAPDWVDETLDVHGEIRLGFWLLRTAVVAIWIFAGREARQALRPAS